jgi:DNA-damage-inducible protein J
MSANAVVRARIDGHIKDEASAVLAAMGLTRIAREKALPFEPLVPNAVTIEAMMGSPRFQCNNWRYAKPALAVNIR